MDAKDKKIATDLAYEIIREVRLLLYPADARRAVAHHDGYVRYGKGNMGDDEVTVSVKIGRAHV